MSTQNGSHTTTGVSQTWKTIQHSNIVAKDVIELIPGSTQFWNPSSHPDFTSSGGTMTFGLLLANTAKNGFPPYTVTNWYDNWAITICPATYRSALLFGSGPTQAGCTYLLQLFAIKDQNLAFQLASSLGEGPVSIGGKTLHLSVDTLFLLSAGNLLPGVFAGYAGVINSQGRATASINTPPIPALVGVKIHTAFVTIDPKVSSGIKSVSNTISYTIT